MSDAKPEARPSTAQETGDVNKYYADAEKQYDEKQGANVSYEPDSAPKVHSNHFKELRPDYAITLKAVGQDQDKKNLDKVMSKLIRQGVYVQVRQGNPGQIFVLAKCSGQRLTSEATKSRSKDWLFGVRTQNPGDTADSGETQEDVLTPAERLRLVYEIITSTDSGAAITPGIGDWEFVETIFPLHDYDMSRELLKRWSTQWFVTERDITALRQQFGAKVGMYFAFVRFYFYWSLFPTVVGVACHFLFGAYSKVFAVLNCLWGIAFIEGWKRKQTRLAIEWNVKGCSAVERRRLNFKGEKDVKDRITDETRPFYSNWKRSVKKLSFLPVALVAALTLMTFQSAVFIIEIFIGQIYDGPFKQYLNYVPTVLLVVLTPVFTAIYSFFVDRSTRWENHETEDSFESSHTSKKFVFNFLVAFMPLFLTAYVYLPFGHLIVRHLDFIKGHVQNFSQSRIPTAESFELNGSRLHQQVIYFVVTAQVINFAMETIVPFVQQKVFSKAKKLTSGELVFSDHPSEAEFMNDVRTQAALPEYDVNEDYRQLVVQFGYTVLFGPVWSLAPLAAVINNFVQLRGDAAKICLDTKRPVPQRYESVGPWTRNLSFLSWLGSLTCASVIAMFGRPFGEGDNVVLDEKTAHDQSMVGTAPWVLLAIVFGAENAFFFAKKVISMLSNAVESPESLQDRRHRFQVRKRYLNETHQDLNVAHNALDPAETEWSAITWDQLEDQIQDAITGPKTMDQKKKQ